MSSKPLVLAFLTACLLMTESSDATSSGSGGSPWVVSSVLDGKYTFTKVVESIGPAMFEQKVKAASRVDHHAFSEEIQTDVRKHDFKGSYEMDASASFFGLAKASAKLSTEYSFHNEAFSSLRESLQKNSMWSREEEFSLRVEIPSGEKRCVYRMDFLMPGVHYESRNALVTNCLHPPEEIPMSFNAKLRRGFLSLLKAVYGVPPSQRAVKHRNGFDGADSFTDGDINRGFGSPYVYLQYETTLQEHEAATEIHFFQRKEDHQSDSCTGDLGRRPDEKKGMFPNLGKIVEEIAGGSFRNLQTLHTSAETFVDPLSVTLVRRQYDRRGETGPFQHCTSDINQGRGGDRLYVCWNSINP